MLWLACIRGPSLEGEKALERRLEIGFTSQLLSGKMTKP